MYDSYPVNAINYHHVVHDETPQPSAPPQTGRERVLHRLASASNTWLKSAAPIGGTLCRMADNYPLSLMLLAVGATLALSGPSVYIIPVCTAALMISVGCLIKIRAVLSSEATRRQQNSDAEHRAVPVNHGGFFTRKAAYPPVPPLTSISTPMQMETIRPGLTPTLPSTPAPASKPGDTPVSSPSFCHQCWSNGACNERRMPIAAEATPGASVLEKRHQKDHFRFICGSQFRPKTVLSAFGPANEQGAYDFVSVTIQTTTTRHAP